ncbi:MAG: hypothetical protein L3J45_10165 [Flavobacteriaceae bacterium]|nr:hypothetical protein [Flavobacteriaceae bacterium]
MPTNTKLIMPLLIAGFLSLTACKDEAKYTPIKKTNTTIPVKEATSEPKSFKDDLHTVKVNEILKTDKYLYINVTEKGVVDPFWIATRIMDIAIGETYFYKGGLLKTNFESKEYNRVFKKIYLISSNLVLANHASNPGLKNKVKPSAKNTVTKKVVAKSKRPQKNIVVKGSIKISELVKNIKKYAGKTVQISGTCTKINAGIMNRNWIHLKDGSKDDYDLVVTSNEFVKEGTVITIKAVVTLNKDFGAGYKYDIILEEGTIIH